METILLFLLAVVVLIALLSYWPRTARQLDALNFSRFFHGLILFGESESFVRVVGPQRHKRITLSKRIEHEDWWLEVAFEGHEVGTDFEARLGSQIAGLSADCKIMRIRDPREEFRFALSGACLRDPASLEAISRRMIKLLGYTPNAKFRIDFEGPKNYDAVDEYFRTRS